LNRQKLNGSEQIFSTEKQSWPINLFIFMCKFLLNFNSNETELSVSIVTIDFV